MKKYISKIVEFLRKNIKQETYSQFCEDIFIARVFLALEIKEPYYLDIGANDYKSLNNTYLFYKRFSLHAPKCSWKGKGVLVEPDPELFLQLKEKRKRDKCLNFGISNENTDKEIEFFLMSDRTHNTFSRMEVEKVSKISGVYIEKTIKVRILTINEVIEKYCDKLPDLISLDIEGMDLDIIKSLDFSRFRPAVFVIETCEYGGARKTEEILAHMKENNYFVYADTWLNTIFVDKEIWNKKIINRGNL